MLNSISCGRASRGCGRTMARGGCGCNRVATPYRGNQPGGRRCTSGCTSTFGRMGGFCGGGCANGTTLNMATQAHVGTPACHHDEHEHVVKSGCGCNAERRADTVRSGCGCNAERRADTVRSGCGCGAERNTNTVRSGCGCNAERRADTVRSGCGCGAERNTNTVRSGCGCAAERNTNTVRSGCGCNGDNQVCQHLLARIQAVDFALYELVLYLDVYPQSCDALETYHKLKEQHEELCREYEKVCGPLTAFGNESHTTWDWMSHPAPWEYGAE